MPEEPQYPTKRASTLVLLTKLMWAGERHNELTTTHQPSRGKGWMLVQRGRLFLERKMPFTGCLLCGRIPALTTLVMAWMRRAVCLMHAHQQTASMQARSEKLSRTDPLHRVNLLNPMLLGTLYYHEPRTLQDRGADKRRRQGGFGPKHVIFLGAR